VVVEGRNERHGIAGIDETIRAARQLVLASRAIEDRERLPHRRQRSYTHDWKDSCHARNHHQHPRPRRIRHPHDPGCSQREGRIRSTKQRANVCLPVLLCGRRVGRTLALGVRGDSLSRPHFLFSHTDE